MLRIVKRGYGSKVDQYVYNLRKGVENIEFPKISTSKFYQIRSEMHPVLETLLARYPNVDHAFGYGSKVFSQGVDVNGSQLDMIFTVSNSQQFHKANIETHSNDYSGLKIFGSNVVSKVGDMGAGVYFNPFVNHVVGDANNGKEVEIELKYGVCSRETLIDDLINWRTLYLAGRLHKPVAVVKNDSQLDILQRYNLMSAVRVALIFLGKETVTKGELYMVIAGLSYMGDPRMNGGENPDKVRNIVDNQYELFGYLYKDIIEDMGDFVVNINDGDVLKVNMDEAKLLDVVESLPAVFKERVASINHASLKMRLEAAIVQTVSGAALLQSIKGILTAGVVRGYRYALAKRSKYNKHKKR
ncbi:putative phosphatidate cytidylyltransferase [Martiniozyma asiatica (nom. inval.)]|nr:putative phosphatidate cytidylyltransferase [Martiniozyma asiatica]